MHTVRLVQAALPYLEASGNGSIVAISSVSGREADFAAGPYGTMKTAIVGYISGLAFQLAERGRPGQRGLARQHLLRGRRLAADRAGEPGPLRDGHRAQPDRAAWARRRTRAKAVVFLSSPVSSRTTGTHLVVDGALTRGIQL